LSFFFVSPCNWKTFLFCIVSNNYVICILVRQNIKILLPAFKQASTRLQIIAIRSGSDYISLIVFAMDTIPSSLTSTIFCYSGLTYFTTMTYGFIYVSISTNGSIHVVFFGNSDASLLMTIENIIPIIN